jgi:hypothetical protein
MISATEVMFMCGSRTIERGIVHRFFERLIALHATYRTLLLHSEDIKLYGDSVTLGNTYLRAHSWQPLNLLQTIYITDKAIASDSRDKIYAVLGLSCDAQRLVAAPDYSLSIEDFYKQFIVLIVKEYNSLEFLSIAGLPVYHRRKNLSLPSWTPDWDHRKGSTLNSNIHQIWEASLTAASGNKPGRASFSNDFNVLTVQGICVDIIDGMSHSVWRERTRFPGYPLQQAQCQTQKYKSALDVVDIASHTPIENPHSPRRPSIFVQKFRDSVAIDEQGNRLTQSRASPFVQWYEHSRYFMISGKMLEQWVDELSSLKFDPNVSKVEEEEYRPKLSVVSEGRDRRLITTEKGYIGLAVNSCVRGDIVCVVFGCSTPVLLRRVGDHYIFLGEAYLHGIMHGEAIDGLGSGEFKEESFCIW